jgi:putative membrane-bound dehydrogenase-like protein
MSPRFKPWWLGTFLSLFAAVLPAAEIQLATDAPKPLSPAESRKLFRLPRGFRIELVASEPFVADPVAMDFDAKGRIFVCEIHGYNLEGYLDALKQNKTGVLDKAVRRIAANPEAVKQAEENQYGTVKLLEDTDGDGRIDRASLWADRLPPCYGVVAARDGVIVLCAPDILYLADRDGDGKAEIREKLFSGFGLYDLWSRINNPRVGLDNWIYVANGIESGGTIRGPRLRDSLRLDSVSFRLKSDGTALEPCTGSSGGYGLALDDWNDRFLVSNQQHVLCVAPVEHRYLKRNPYYAAPNPVVNVSTYGTPARVYPTSQPDPWRLARSKDPAWVRFYGEAETTANGFFTAASGQCIYRGDLFPPEYRGNHFSVDNAQNLIHRCVLEPDGVLCQARRPQADEKDEFLTSTEQWFRPVHLMVGPDGGLYVVDMYRAIIEDYSAIPRYLQQQYVESLIAGADKGRIWRIVPEKAGRAAPFDLNRATSDELVARLSSPNAWWRTTAQRLLVERREAAAAPRLRELAVEGETPQARLHALYALDGLGILEPRFVERGLDDPHFAVRTHALMLGERWLDREPGLLPRVIRLATDPEPRVRLQLALTLGESRDSRAVQALRSLAVRHGKDRWLQAAILSSTAETSGALLASFVAAPDELGEASALVHPLASIVGARRNDEELGNLLKALADARDPRVRPLVVDGLQGLVEGLKRSKLQPLESPSGRGSLPRLLAADPQTAQLALTVAGLVRLRDSEVMKAAYATASTSARDREGKLEDRLAAVRLLATAPYDDVAATAKDLLEPRQPLDLQLEAMRTLSASDDPRVAEVLLTNWQAASPKVQEAALDALFARQNRLPKLLDAVAAGTVLRGSLDAFRRVQLLENPDPTVRKRAQTLVGSLATGKDREKVMKPYLDALARPRDAKRGKAVFDKQCAKCHQVKGEGYVVGPDLSATRSRTDEMLVSDVLDPSNQLTAGYNQYSIVTEDGRIFKGVLAAETATSVTLRREQAAEDVILRKDIEQMAASTSSMMPENLEKEVTPQELADLIAFVRSSFGTAPPSVVLFDDEQPFVDLLKEGDGTATLDTAERFAGQASLKITPPQRFSQSIPGWNYRIAENPGPGEYRYLRFAWKSRGGQGVMLELAADGKWPPPDKPLWRYFSGKNTVGWSAVQVATEAPAQWTVVTRDLWKEFGAFTLTGIAPTAMGGEAWFDRIELLRTLDEVKPGK